MGFSAADFVAVLNGPAAPEQYQIYGRYRLTRDWTLRTAARYRQLFAEDDRLELAVRIGADRVLRDGKRLQLYIGLDAIGGYDRSFGEDRTYRIGGAPLFGMLVFVTDYLSFSVEPRLVGLYSSFDNPAPSPDADEWTVGLKGNNLLIVSLHF
ncbi:MAG: hypothetical protein BRD55_02520 [Bacteroidetes bacterium SW_9_63_38]|nr:MAG: hypothetical protein BRD55_02520 [Bacteroidetes bacterium SW_9_63_38]